MHTVGCQWERTHIACSCHQPTVWGGAALFACDCCGEPRAPIRFTLCPECEAHQDAPTHAIASVHRSMSDDDGLDSAPAGAGSGLSSCLGCERLREKMPWVMEHSVCPDCGRRVSL